MSATKETGTEEKIKEAARLVFLEKGFDGTKIRDIADVAGINSALTNYYFRSKERLFWLVFDEMLQQTVQEMRDVLNRSNSLQEKIVELIQHQHLFNSQNPKIALFMMNEIRRNPERFAKKTGLLELLHSSLFSRQVEEAVQKKELRPISSAHLLGLMTGSSHQLFAGKDLHMFLFKTDEEGFKEYADKQLNFTIDMILGYFFLKK